MSCFSFKQGFVFQQTSALSSLDKTVPAPGLDHAHIKLAKVFCKEESQIMTKIEVDRESGWEEVQLLEDASDLRAPDYEERLERSRMRLPHRHLLVDLGPNTVGPMRGWYSLAMDTCTKVDGICYPVYVKRADDEPPMYLYRTLAPNDLPLWQISYGGGKPEDILAVCVTDCKDPRLIEEYWLVPEFCQKTGQVKKKWSFLLILRPRR